MMITGNPSVRNCSIYENEYGVNVWGGGGEFSYCRIFENNEAGIFAIQPTTRIRVRRSHIHENRGNGIFVGYSARGVFENVKTQRNEKENFLIDDTAGTCEIIR